MSYNNELTDRLLSLFELLKKGGKVKNQVDFCNKIGISQSFFTEIKKGRSGITIDKLQNITEEFNEYKEWLLTGKMIKSGDRNEANEQPSQLYACRECKKKDEEIKKWRDKYDDMTAKYLAVLEEIKDKKVS